ncbi:alpha/beta hydrolase family protein [Phycicoccus flavus]|uniref:Phthalyl amidase n=1 Tax=Phycicoccus flavus TaxID=2502783 RepID=A0A8T6R796_9MICO|nr:phthalyl amidase [Phycicoccus flavus]NHA69612.1 phthalyl amidase [Phycicoccus flavus]
MRRVLTAALTALALVTAGAGAAVAGPKPTYEVDRAALAATVAAVERATGQDATSGEIAGAAYVAQVPDNWNGDLVVYAHGYRGTGTALTVDPPPAYQALVAQGYAWAASSYRRNDYDPGVGVLDTKNLTEHMRSVLGRELDRTYLVGFSMGGHVTAAAIEKYPSLYDGALPACGVLGDVELFDWFTDYNLGAADYAGLAAADVDYPSETWLADTVPTIEAGLSNAPGPSWAFALNDRGRAFKDFVEVGSGGDRVTFDTAWRYWHAPQNESGTFLFGLAAGDGTIANRTGQVGQNSDTVYGTEYGPAFAGLDDSILRVQAANRNRKSQGLQPAPIIHGTPSVPVLTLHTTGDLFVPIEMEQIYAKEVRANGRGDLLVQRAVRDVGHCSFTGQEIVTAYTDLFRWVETGVRPAGEDLVADISSPTLGCAFTRGTGGSGLRPVLEPCPT